LLLGAAGVFNPAMPETVEAHALLVRADPPVNAQLPEAPTVLSLYFSEPLERRFSGVRVVDQNGEQVQEAVEFDDQDDALMRVRLRPLSPGYISVRWETVSTVDGHRISGSYPITILNPDGSLPAGRPIEGGVTVSGEEADPARLITKWLLLLSGAALAGAFAFRVFVTPGLAGEDGEHARAVSDVRSVYVAGLALVVLAAGGIAELILQAADIGQGIGDVLETRWGERWLWRNGLLILPAAVIAIDRATSRPVDLRRSTALLGLMAACGYLAIVSSVSHSAAGAGAFWAAASDFVHLLAASVWIGMLGLLAWLFIWAGGALDRNERYPVLASALQRFSAVAVVSLALLLFTGVVNAVIQVERLADLVDTGYGRALLIKLLLLIPLLVVAGLNATIYRPRFVLYSEGAGNPRVRPTALAELEERFHRTLRWELALAVVVLLVVAVLVQLTPTRGRLAAVANTGRFVETKGASNIDATLVIDPNETGINSFEVYITGGVDVVENVRLNFEALDGDFVSLSRLDLTPSSPPYFYVGRGPFIDQPGKWRVEVDMRRSHASDLAIPFSVTVPAAGGVAPSARGGDTFGSPLSLTTGSAILLAATAALALILVAGSIRQPGLPAGYLGLFAAEVANRLHGVRLRPAWSLFGLVIIGTGFGLLLGSHLHSRLSNEEARQGNPVESSPESIERGRLLFSQNCIQCHGETGRGDGPLASTLPIPPANLYDHIPYHPDEFFFSVITNGLSGVMPAFRALPEEDRWHILNYLRDQFGQPPAAR
jgi:copper transport protein